MRTVLVEQPKLRQRRAGALPTVRLHDECRGLNACGQAARLSAPRMRAAMRVVAGRFARELPPHRLHRIVGPRIGSTRLGPTVGQAMVPAGYATEANPHCRPRAAVGARECMRASDKTADASEVSI